MHRIYAYLLLGLCLPISLFAQSTCPDTTDRLLITLRTDAYGYETRWDVRDNTTGEILAGVSFDQLANRRYYESPLCLGAADCVTFTIYDQFGDGMADPAFVRLIFQGDTIDILTDFGREARVDINCRTGQVCSQATTVTEGNWTTTYEDSWYAFTPPDVGIYRVSTCGANSCDTQIWVYPACENTFDDNENAGTAFYNDNNENCGQLASVDAFLDADVTYYIRIGDRDDACTMPINWSLTYLGPVIGCMDPDACNYEPLATIDDGSCVPQDDPTCPEGPDLELDEAIFAASLIPDTVFNDDPCLIEEGCLRGYGDREVIRFTTRMHNRGERDYYIGTPNAESGQFTWNNCHSHYHFDNYTEYLLFDSQERRLPIGFKSGFCVIDLECGDQQQKYSCRNMGISAGCYDEYWTDIECQWIDVTEIADGEYTLVVRLNWQNKPDALGQQEKNLDNNWAQACFRIDRSSGSLQVEILSDCPPYFDCAGTRYGPKSPDCQGVCGGSALRGDINRNDALEMADAQQYVDDILSGAVAADACNDLNADGRLSVYDAALLSSCLNFGQTHQHSGQGIHDHCNFPAGIDNQRDTVRLSLIEVDWSAGYLDVGIQNPAADIMAYQFTLEGAPISQVESLLPADRFPVVPRYSIATGQVIGISYQDSLIRRSAEGLPLCRIYFDPAQANLLCLGAEAEAVNARQERTVVSRQTACAENPVATAEAAKSALPVQVTPNPFRTQALLSFPNPQHRPLQIDLLTVDGKILRSYPNVRHHELKIERGQLPTGIYLYRLRGERVWATGRLMITP